MPETRSKLYQVTWPVTPVIRATLCSLIVDSYFLLANITQLLLNNNFANFVSIVQYNKSTFSVSQFYLYTCNNVNMHTFCFQYASCFLHKLLLENILLAKKIICTVQHTNIQTFHFINCLNTLLHNLMQRINTYLYTWNANVSNVLLTNYQQIYCKCFLTMTVCCKLTQYISASTSFIHAYCQIILSPI